MTFKEKLTAKAEGLHIDYHIEYIKKQMDLCFSYRKYIIGLVKGHKVFTREVLAEVQTKNYSELSIPEGVTPEYYQLLFVKAFKELGFTNNDIELTSNKYDSYEIYKIILKW